MNVAVSLEDYESFADVVDKPGWLGKVPFAALVHIDDLFLGPNVMNGTARSRGDGPIGLVWINIQVFLRVRSLTGQLDDVVMLVVG